MDLIHAGLAQHGTCVFTHHQTAGKGRMGKEWVSEAGNNIALSIVLEPTFLMPLQAFRLSVIVALSAFDMLNERAKGSIFIKWPNDIYCIDKKTGGILIENIFSSGGTSTGKWQYAVVGIGININQQSFSADIPHAGSLSMHTGKQYACVELAKELCFHLDKRFRSMQQIPFSVLLQEYNDHLFKKNQTLRFRKGNIVFEAQVRGVDEHGDLILYSSHEERYSLDTISWIL